MQITVEGVSYKINIPGPDPFAIMGDKVIGVTPWADADLLEQIRQEWHRTYAPPPEEQSWHVAGTKRDHIVMLIGNKWLCDCWPFRRFKTCKHIEDVRGEWGL